MAVRNKPIIVLGDGAASSCAGNKWTGPQSSEAEGRPARPWRGVPGESYEKLNVLDPGVGLVPLLRVAPPKLPVVLLKTAGVAVHAAGVPAAVKLLLLSAKVEAAAKRASISQK